MGGLLGNGKVISGGGFNGAVAAASPADMTPSMPDPTVAKGAGIASERDVLKRRSASQVLFTGGQGLLDAPSTASTSLFGGR